MRYGGTVALIEDDFFELRRIGNLSQSFSHKWENVNPHRTALACMHLLCSVLYDLISNAIQKCCVWHSPI